MDPLIGRTLGPYELMAKLGSGGMSTVYRAVKVLPPNLAADEEFVERFQREARTAAELRHPNIVQIYDVGQHDATYYIAMELVDGISLQDLVQSSGQLPLDRTLSILGLLADALDYAHGRGVVHRDVKASNVIVGPGDRATLLDFGIARAAAGARLTRTGVIVGTPEYLAPEAITGDATGPSTDLYALGVVAYELIAGRVPFPGLDTPAMLYAQAHRPPPRPRSFRSDLPEPIEQVVMRQLAKLPAARYSSAGGFVAALFAALSSSPTRPDLEETDEAPTIMRAGPPTPVMERAAPP